MNIQVLQFRSRDRKDNQRRCKKHSNGLPPHLAEVVRPSVYYRSNHSSECKTDLDL